MHISLEAIMRDYKEWQRKKAAMNGAIERYTEERMADEYGRIHTDGSRSGGQPVVDNAMLDALQKDAGLPHLPTQETYQFRMAVSGEGPLAYQWSDKPHRLLYDACSIIESEAALRTYSDAVRDLVATLWCASGCSCCRDDDAWGKASHELAELLGIPKYDDGSGYDWYSVCDAAKEQSK